MGLDGQYTRGGFLQMFDEGKRYIGTRMQKGVPVVDADINDLSDSIVHQLRRVIQATLGDGALLGNNGFRIEEAASNSNNFEVEGGSGTDETAGQFFVGGLPCRLSNATDYISASKDIHPQVSSVAPLVLTDDSGNWGVDELVGRDLVPDVDFPAVTHAVVSNTATTITVGAGPGLTTETAAGKHYRVNLTTPGAPRSDEVYLDVFLDEVSTAEDANLVHMLGAPPASYDGAFRLVVRQLVKVREGATAPSGQLADGVGRLHHYLRVAALSRPAAAAITAANIADTRPLTASGFNAIRRLASKGGIDGTAVGPVTIYPVPALKTVVPFMVVLRPTTAAGVASPPSAGVGVAPGEDDIFAPESLTGLDAVGKVWVFSASRNLVAAAGGSTISLGIDVGAVGAALTLEAILFGFEF